jgi:ribosomal protein L37AE/L43A
MKVAKKTEAQTYYETHKEEIKKRRKARYHERIKEHCCPACGKKMRATYKLTYCPDCLVDLNDRQKNVDRDSVNEQRRTRYETRKDDHLCPRCGKKLRATYTATLCKTCLDYSKDHR